ncbi:MAG: Gfo/Idh/MocA family oxidoreductase [Bryobacterales bacterium]|nr:Gfo/Idh/MocA family oxidoreductase [Bryobacterales bacterium]
MNRRSFFSLPVAVAMAGVSAGAANTKTGPIGVAFLGASYSHADPKIKLVMSSPQYSLKAVWDEEDSVRRKLAARGLSVVEPGVFLTDPAVEAVIVESDVPDHQRHAKMALEAGKHVHVEKPPATDISSFRELIDLALRKKLYLQQGYMWRHHPGFLALHEQARSGVIGDIYLVTAVMEKTLEASRRPAWARFRGGQMFEQCSHLIDQMVRLMGRPDRITSFLKKNGKFADNLTDNTAAVFEFPNALGIVRGSALNPNGGRQRSFTVNGTLGTLTLDPIEPGSLWIEAGKQPRRAIETPKYVRFVDDFKEFAAAIREGKPLSVSPADEMVVQECVIEASGM